MRAPRRYAGLTLGLALTIAAGCGERGAAPLGGGDEVEQGGTVIIAEIADLNQPSPLLFASLLDGALASDIMNRELLRGEWRDGRLVYVTADESPMAIARSFEVLGADSATVRFAMRSGLRWSDGAPLTAHDVKFTYDLVQDPALASPRRDFVQHLDSVSVQNDSTVTFHYRRRYPEMFAHAAIPPVPRHIYQDVAPAEFRNHPSITSPAGNLVVSGPFMIGRHVRNQQFVLVRNPHFEPRANLDQIVFRVISDPTTRLVELQTGAVDWVQNVTFDQIPRLRQQVPDLRWEVEERRVYDYIAYNPGSFEAFRNPEVRRALGMAIDAPALIRALQMEEFAEPAGGPYPPILTDLYDPSSAPPLRHDPEEARRILAAQGWTDSDGDGILDRNGTPFRFTLTTNAGNQRRGDAVQIVQQQWRQIGVDAQLRLLETNTFMTNLFEGNYQAALGGWVTGLTADLTQAWGADAPVNITRYRHPELQQLFERAQAQPSPEGANPFWRQAAAHIAQAQPYTWLYFFDSVSAINDRVRGVTVNSYGAYQNSWEWWIPSDRRRPGGAGAAATDTATRDTAAN
jgi:peptide/nickel transport system substrate-binding protein